MAPVTTKRRRPDRDERPKKKPKPIKKQKHYHSSSEDEDDAAPSQARVRASDAPRPGLEAGSVRPSTTKSAKFGKKSGKEQVPVRSAAPSDPKQRDTRPIGALVAKQKPTAAAKEIADEEQGSEQGDESGDEDILLNTTAEAAEAEISEDDDDEVEGLDDLDATDEPTLDSAEDDVEGDDDLDDEVDEYDLSDDESTTSSQAVRSKKKRNDPTAFATSISKILDTKLTTSKRADPVLSRSKTAADANRTIADEKLAQKARAQIRAERRQAAEKGRVKDVLGLQTPDVDTGAIMELEKRLKKTAQRGVVKLFNAVRAAQVKGEEAMRQARSDGVIGMGQREEKASEMSKQGFLDLISSGGKKTAVAG